MKSVIFLLFGFLFTNLLSAQIEVQWDKTIGGNAYDESLNTIQTQDGGYLILCTSESGIFGDKTDSSRGGEDFWIVKLDASYQIEWDKTFGGNENDYIADAVESSDGGYVITGSSSSDSSAEKSEHSLGLSDYWVMKINASGVVEWENTIGGNLDDRSVAIIKHPTNGYLIGGYSKSGISGDKTENAKNGSFDYWIVQIDNMGVVQWDNTIGGDDLEFFSGITPTVDAGFLLYGKSKSNISADKTQDAYNGSNDYWIVKVDSLGVVEWDKTIGGDEQETISSLITHPNGGYITLGASASEISGDKTEASIGDYDYWLVKIDETGIVEWDKTIGGADLDYPSDVILTENGGYLLNGTSISDSSGHKSENSFGDSDIWMVQLDSNKDVAWEKTIGGNDYDEPVTTLSLSESSYLSVGYSYSDSSGYKTENSKGDADIWMFNITTAPQPPVGEKPTLLPHLIKISPNPAQEFCELLFKSPESGELKVIDAQGKTVYSFTLNNQVSIGLNTSSWAKGNYIFQLSSKNQYIGRVVIR